MARPRSVVSASRRAPEDDELAARLSAHDPGALAQVVQTFWDPLTRYAARLLGDLDGAKDIAQEALLRLWEAQGRGEAASLPVRSYLYRVAHNLAVDELRKRTVRRRWHHSGELGSGGAPASPGELFEQRELRLAIERAVRGLPARRREVFVLAYFHDLSYQEIADVAGISPATVKNHITAALADLRAALRPAVVGSLTTPD